MTEKRITLGRSGEEAAVRCLREKGIKIICRNFRCKLGELDIVARDGPYLVFVEVRTVAGGGFGTAQESIHARKKQKIRQLAAYYLLKEKLHDVPVRFDVAAVTINPHSGSVHIDHIVDAF